MTIGAMIFGVLSLRCPAFADACPSCSATSTGWFGFIRAGSGTRI